MSSDPENSLRHRRHADWIIRWPDPPLRIVLVEPEIPPNTGTIARLCAATGTPLHLIEPLGFQLTDRALKRAGLDYWESVELHRHTRYSAFEEAYPAGQRFLFSTGGARPYTEAVFQPGDVLVFGPESRGLPDELLSAHPQQVLGIPMRRNQVRSLNLATAVAIALFEALRQVTASGPPADG